MVHSPNEGAQDPKHAFNLTRMGKLKLLVNIPVVGHIPPGIHPHIDGSAIGIDTRLGCHVRLQEVPGVLPSGSCMRENLIGKLFLSHLLSHEEGFFRFSLQSTLHPVGRVALGYRRFPVNVHEIHQTNGEPSPQRAPSSSWFA